MKTARDSERLMATPSDVHAIWYCDGFPEHCATSYKALSGTMLGRVNAKGQVSGVTLRCGGHAQDQRCRTARHSRCSNLGAQV